MWSFGRDKCNFQFIVHFQWHTDKLLLYSSADKFSSEKAAADVISCTQRKKWLNVLSPIFAGAQFQISFGLVYAHTYIVIYDISSDEKLL